MKDVVLVDVVLVQPTLAVRLYRPPRPMRLVRFSGWRMGGKFTCDTDMVNRNFLEDFSLECSPLGARSDKQIQRRWANEVQSELKEVFVTVSGTLYTVSSDLL